MLLLDLLLLIMIIICIAYCWVLNQRIRDLHNSRVEFARMIKELNVSITQAQSSVDDLSRTSKAISDDLKDVLQESKDTKESLVAVTQIGNDLLDKMSKQQQILKKAQQSANADIINTDIQENKDAQTDTAINEKSNKINTRNVDQQDSEVYSAKQSAYNYLKNVLSDVIGTKTDHDKESINIKQNDYYQSLRRISTKK